MALIRELTLSKYALLLRRYGKKEFPQVIKATLRATAFDTRDEIRQNIPITFTTRNKFTEGSIRANGPKGSRISDFESSVGSIQGYMKIQEDGGMISSGIKRHKIPTADSRVGKRSDKVVAPRFRLDRVGDLRKTRSKRIINKPFFGGFKREGIYIRKARLGLRLLYDLSNPSVTIRKRPWLAPAVKFKASQGELEKRYIRFSIARLKKLRSF